MVRFIIVEDDEKNIKQIKEIINKQKYKIDFEIKTYEFKKYTKELHNLIMDKENRTVYILDIELGSSKSGIEIASIIRNYDWNSEIIFITNHDKMFEMVHRNVYDVFDFIEKYHDLNKRLTKDINLILNHHDDREIFKYHGRNLDLQLYMNTINYVYRDKEDRKVNIVTDNNTFSINLGVKEILSMLDGRFKMVHRSCVVNTDKVENYDWNNLKVILKNGEEINYLSKKFKKDI